ncbi:MAG: carboxypeptidase-like regulatory domain-containing protein [Pirellulales bacterium]
MPPSLEGRIVDDRGQPVTDAQIEAIGAAGRQVKRATTDDNGRYQIPAVTQEEEFRLRITSEKWVGITDYSSLPLVRLSPDSKTVRDFTLPRACRIRVQVVNELLEPVPNVPLYMASLADERYRNARDRVTTGRDGYATIGGLTPSEVNYIIAPMSNEYAPARLVTKLNDPETLATGMIMLTRGVDVKATVLCSDGKPATGWRLIAMPDWWRFSVSPRGEEIAADGSVTLKNISPGTYNLFISIPTSDTSSRRSTAQSGVKLPPDAGPLAVKLDMPSPQSMGVIAGRVRFSGAAPKSSISVSARSEDGQSHAFGHVSVSDGTFRLTPVPPGRYTVDFESTEIEEKTIPNVTAPVENLDVELTVRGKLVLRGVAVRSDTGGPLTNFRVRIAKLQTLRGANYVPDKKWHPFENSRGEFEVELVGPGVYQVLIAADGVAWTRSQPVNTDENKGARIGIELKPGVSLTGSVVDEQGRPIDGAKVIPLSKAGSTIPGEMNQFASEDGATETAGGRFTLDHLEPGKDQLKVTHPDYCFTIVNNIDVPKDGGRIEPITLRAGGTVRGRVYDAEGQPQRNVTLVIQDATGYSGDPERGRLATAVTNANGDYEARHLPEQMCYVVRENEWNSLGVVRHALFPEYGKTHTLDLGGQTRLTGRLVINGVPAAGKRLMLGGDYENFGIFAAYAQTDVQGNFVFWGLPPGKRTLYYSQSEQRNSWTPVRELQLTGAPTDLRAVEHNTVKLLVRYEPMPDSATHRVSMSLQRFNAEVMPARAIQPSTSAAQPGQPFVFEAVPPDQYELAAGASPQVRQTQPQSTLGLRQRIEVVAGKPGLEVTVRMPTGTASVRGQLPAEAAPDRRPFPRAIWSKDRRLWGSLAPGKDGAFELAGLPAGDYFLSYGDNFWNPKPIFEFSLADGEQKTIDTSAEPFQRPLPEEKALNIYTFSTEGVPLPGCEFKFAGADDLPRWNSVQDNYASFTGTPGDYELTVSYPGFETLRRKVTIGAAAGDAPGGLPMLKLQLQPAAR